MNPDEVSKTISFALTEQEAIALTSQYAKELKQSLMQSDEKVAHIKRVIWLQEARNLAAYGTVDPDGSLKRTTDQILEILRNTLTELPQ